WTIYFVCTHPSSTAIYTLSLHDALPILAIGQSHLVMSPTIGVESGPGGVCDVCIHGSRQHCLGIDTLRNRQPYIEAAVGIGPGRSEEHTSELQSRFDLVCRLLLEKENDK